MKIPRRVRRRPFVPISAMSDIAFLLLIFIMLISLMHYRREVRVQYPEGENLQTTEEKKNLDIWVDKTGGMYVQGEPYPLQAVEWIIAEQIMREPTVRIHLIADRDTPYRHVNSVLEILKKLQHRAVSLVVREPKP